MTSQEHSDNLQLPEGLDALLPYLPGGVVFTSEAGLILKANALFLHWSGYTGGELINQRRVVDLLNAGGRIFYETHLALLLKVNGELNSVALDLISKNGEIISVLVNVRQQKDSTGAVLLNCFTFIDARNRRVYECELLAARKEAERSAAELSALNASLAESNAEIQRRTKELTRANEDLLHFAYAVSHDLQAPLRAVTTFSQLLSFTYKPQLGEQGDRFISQIVKASTRMATMIADLLKYAEVAGDQVPHRPEFPLENSLRIALETLSGSIAEASATITHDSLPVVIGEPGQLAQLFQNLIGNAIKYRKNGTPPVIHITANREGNDWMISVRDNGVGFDPKDAETIFGVFQRLHGAEVSGTGIGLTICKRIAERHGGKIWATATPGEGATFTFSVPVEGVSRPNYPRQSAADRLPNGYLPQESGLDPKLFDELFHTLDLAQAVIRNMEGKILIWTQGAEHLFGWTKEEAIGHRIQELLQKEFPKPIAEIEAELLRNGEWSGELAATKKDGSTVWLASHLSLYRDGSGRPQSVVEIHNGINALKEAQAAAQRSSELRDLALHAGQMGTWDWDIQTDKVQWSSTIEQILGMAPGSFGGTFEAYVALVHPDDIEAVQHSISQSLASGGKYQVEFRLRRADGCYSWMRGIGEPKFSREEQPIGLVGVVWDNSERKQAELDQKFVLDLHLRFSELAEEAELIAEAVGSLGTYLRASRCLFAETVPDTKQMRISPGYPNLGPGPAGMQPLSSFGDFTAEFDANQSVAITDVAQDSRIAQDSRDTCLAFSMRALLAVPIHCAGQWRCTLWVAHAYAYPWSSREIELVRNIAERLGHNLEKARLVQIAQYQRQRFEATFNQAAVGLAHIGMDGRWLHMNQRICEITGYTQEELLTLTFQDITHAEDLQIDLDKYAALQRGETQSYSIEKRYVRKNGSVVWINLTVSMVRNAEGVPNYAVSVIEDISERKAAQQSLNQRTEQRDLALQAGQMATWEWDSKTGVASWSQTIETILGWSTANAATKQAGSASHSFHRTLAAFLQRIHPEDRAAVRQRIVGPYSSAGDYSIEFRILRADQSYGWLRSQGKTKSTAGEHATSVVGVIWDITEHKRTEARWHEIAERLELNLPDKN